MSGHLTQIIRSHDCHVGTVSLSSSSQPGHVTNFMSRDCQVGTVSMSSSLLPGHMTIIQSHDCHVGTVSLSSSSQHLHTLHLQHSIHGAASNKKGEATSNSTPNPANIPTTCNILSENTNDSMVVRMPWAITQSGSKFCGTYHLSTHHTEVNLLELFSVGKQTVFTIY